MTTRDEELQKEVQRIVDKYDQSVYKLSQYATAKEFKTVMKYVADFAKVYKHSDRTYRQSVALLFVIIHL